MKFNANSVAKYEMHVPAFDRNVWQGKTQPWCIVIPVINEGERIKKLLSKMLDLKSYQSADIIIVDGGSTDGSLERSYLEKTNVRGLLTKTSPGGLSAQLRCAYAFALEQEYEGIITIDGNNKDDPSAIKSFIKALSEGVDFTQGSRFISNGVSENTPISRALAIRLIHAPILSLFSGFKWTDTTQGFRGYSQKLLSDPKIAPFRTVFDSYELLAYLSYRAPKLGFKCIEIPTKRSYPKGEVPTKISGFRGNLKLISILLKTCFGKYNPTLDTNATKNKSDFVK